MTHSRSRRPSSRSAVTRTARSARASRMTSPTRRWACSRTTKRSARASSPPPLHSRVVPTLKIPPVLRNSTGGEREVEGVGANVGEALRDLPEKHPATQSQLFGEDGELNRYVNVYLNDEDVRVLQGLDTPVGDSDTIVILPAMAGGC